MSNAIRKDRRKWFRKTLTGYKVIWVSPEHEVTFKHRPFRQPEIISLKSPAKSIRGTRVDTIVMDEFGIFNEAEREQS